MLWCQWVTLLSGSIATLLNASLLPIIVFYSSEKMGAYKNLLLLYTLTAFFMTICQVNSLAAWWAPKNGYVFYSAVDFYPLWLQNIFLYGFCTGFSANLFIICWSYYARLSILQGLNILETPIKRSVKVAGVLSVFYWITLFCDVYLINRTDNNVKRFAPVIWDVARINLQDVAFIGGEVTLQDGKLNWRLFVSLGIMTSHMIGVTIFVLICWFKIRRRLNEMRKMQSTSFRVQYRLYILLTFQALFPLTFNTTPAALAFLSGLFQIEMDFVISLCGAILSFAQILDPILTVFFITEYREVILKIFGLKKNTIYGDNSGSGH